MYTFLKWDTWISLMLTAALCCLWPVCQKGWLSWNMDYWLPSFTFAHFWWQSGVLTGQALHLLEQEVQSTLCQKKSTIWNTALLVSWQGLPWTQHSLYGHIHHRSNWDCSIYNQISIQQWWLMCNIGHNMHLLYRFSSTALHPGSCNSHPTSSFHLQVIALSIQWR